jgi:hypothetical protein
VQESLASDPREAKICEKLEEMKAELDRNNNLGETSNYVHTFLHSLALLIVKNNFLKGSREKFQMRRKENLGGMRVTLMEALTPTAYFERWVYFL